jgi:hypothetical protein
MSAESEFRASGWPPFTCGVALAYVPFLALGVLLACGGVPLMVFRVGTLPVRIPVLFPCLLVLGASEGVRCAWHRSRRYVIDASGVLTVTGGLLRERVLARVEPASVVAVQLEKRGVPIVRTHQKWILLGGTGPELLEALKKAWPQAPFAESDTLPPRRSARAVLLLVIVFAALSLLFELSAFVNRSLSAARVQKVTAAVTAARAATVRTATSANPAATVCDASSGPYYDSMGFSEGGPGWSITIGVRRAGEAGLNLHDDWGVSVSVVAPGADGLYFPWERVVIWRGRGSQDDVFVKELTKELDAAGVRYTIDKMPP